MDSNFGWQLSVLGAFRLMRGDRKVQFARRRKAASLLAYLALHPETHRRDHLATLLWGDYSDSAARHSLRMVLSTLRSELGDDVIITGNETAQINPTFPLWVDACAFQSYASRFLAEAPFDLSSSFIDLYQGDLLADFTDDWIIPLRERLHALYIDVLLHVTQHMRSRSEYERAIETAQRVLATDPSNERAHQHLIFCYVAMGDRSAALKQYDQCRRVLQDDLAVEPMAETQALYQWIKGRPLHSQAREARITNLPIPLTSFVGREQETAEVKRLLSQTRLLTLAGPGGSGKTRLAIQVATDLVDAYKDGVWFVDLSGVQEPSLAARAVAQTLGLGDFSSEVIEVGLASALRTRHMLLVLDNCEHLAAACAHLAGTVLAAAAGVKILATSRETLDVLGEIVCQVPALSLPVASAIPPTLAALSGFQATRLFIERAAAACPGSPLLDQDAVAVAAVCRQLEGMPLAIELAASRVKVLSVRQIADHLRDRFALLASGSRSLPPRHNSLRAAIDWSYELLSSDEQALFRRLSVFVGGFDLAGAAAVYGGDEPQALDLLSRLIDKSLVTVLQAGEEARYRLLETIRLYAWDRLAEDGEKDMAVRRFVSFYAAMVAAYSIDRMPSDAPEWSQQYVLFTDRLPAEHDNLRAAITWSRATEQFWEGARIVDLWEYWMRTGEMTEFCDWIDIILAHVGGVPPATEAMAFRLAGRLARLHADTAQAQDLCENALATARCVGDRQLISYCATEAGRNAIALGNCTRAIELLEEAMTLVREGGALIWLADAYMRQGDLDRSLTLWQEVVTIGHGVGGGNLTWGFPFSIQGMGHIARLRGDYEQAGRLYRESLSEFMGRRHRGESIIQPLEALAALAALQGKAERSTLLWSAADAIRAARRLPRDAFFEADYAPSIAAVRRQLGDEQHQELHSEGEQMTMEQAVELALA